tara:strand:- start:172 stop:315 length:144 start_codon:yes stop_codon:yes gene_type:complete
MKNNSEWHKIFGGKRTLSSKEANLLKNISKRFREEQGWRKIKLLYSH